ncbi:hypothetical protein MCEMSEM23_01922 [Rhabdaerophilaceae bacterium]
METERGRWFLAEYAKRHRHAETVTILEAIDKLSHSIPSRQAFVIGSEDLHRQILDMARAILRTEQELRSMRKKDAKGAQFAAASTALDSVIGTTEQATSAILSAAERVQEIAWTLREKGFDTATCEELDASATEIYTACGFQDLTAQRIAKAIETLKFLDKRIRILVEAAGLSEAVADEIEDIEATIAMEPAEPENDIWMSKAHQAEIDETFDFFTPAEQAEPTMIGADLLDLEPEAQTARMSAPPQAPVADSEDFLVGATSPPDGPANKDALAEYESLSIRERFRAFR